MKFKNDAVRLLGRYAYHPIDPEDVIQTATVEFLEAGGGTDDQMLVFVALVANRFKQDVRRKLLRVTSLNTPIGNTGEEGVATLGDFQVSRSINPLTNIQISEVLEEAIEIAEAELGAKPNCESKTLQINRILNFYFLAGAESFRAAYDFERRDRKTSPLSRTAACALWRKVCQKLRIRFSDLRPKGESGEFDNRRK